MSSWNGLPQESRGPPPAVIRLPGGERAELIIDARAVAAGACPYDIKQLINAKSAQPRVLPVSRDTPAWAGRLDRMAVRLPECRESGN